MTPAQDRRSLPLLAIPEEFTPEELARVCELAGVAIDDERLVDFVADAISCLTGRRRGREGWVEGVAHYVRRRARRPARLVEVPEARPANVVSLAAWRERMRDTIDPGGAA